MEDKKSAGAMVGRAVGAVVAVIAVLAGVFIGVPWTVELSDSGFWSYLAAYVVTFPICVVAGWRLISDGLHPYLGAGLFYGSILFYFPTFFLLMNQLSNLGES